MDKILTETKTTDFPVKANSALSSMNSSILKEIEKELIDPPTHGTISISLIFHDSRFTRWVLTREVSKQAE